MFPLQYLIDTNVLLDYPQVVSKYNCIVLSHVLRELDNLKYKNDTLGFKVRRAVRALRENQVEYDLNDYTFSLSPEFDEHYTDNKIIQCAKEKKLVIISNDILLSEKCKAFGIECIQFAPKLHIYNGLAEFILGDEELAQFHLGEYKISTKNLLNNQYVLLYDNYGNSVEKYRFFDGKLHKIKAFRAKNTQILKPLDDVQACAYDALLNPDIKIVALIGKSGTGKTKSAISVALDLLERGLYEKIILVRHAVESGQSIGFLPGDKLEKLIGGWGACFIDNLPGEKYQFDRLIQEGKIELESAGLLKGRDIHNAILIFDECEDSSEKQMEIVGTRLHDSSKGIFVGDYRQTSQDRYNVDSGLLRLIDKAKGKEWFACVELRTSGRGQVSTFFSEEYKESTIS